ncbi:MAG TPA: EAL domain-containing protein [Solirubrobacteraceae bacterium]|jgi:diguanylate cyclase (GGDEF)-like protein
MGGLSRVLVDPGDPTPNRRHIARSLGLLFFIQGTLGEGWLLLPHDARHVQAVVLVCVLAQVLGIWMRRGGFDAAPLWVLKAIITLGTLLATAGCVFTGAGTGFAFFFLWVTPYAVYFGLRQAAFQTGIAVLGLVASRVAIADGQFVASQVGQWLLPAATIIVVSSIVHQLTRELGRADRERLVSERERAEAEARRAASERERAHREAAMARLGRLALRASDRALLLDETVRVLTETLRVEHCAIHELQEDGTHMRAVAAIGFDDGDDIPADEQRLGGYVLAGDEPIIVWEWASERRFSVPSLRDRGIRATSAAAIRGRSGAFGIIAVHSATVGAFSGEEGQWLQSIADLLASALDRERSEAVMRHQSLHDALTGLPNRALLFDRVEHAFSRAERFSLGVAVLLLDLDGFKTVNDSLGHQAGDELLVEVGHRLQDVVRTSDTVARLGGDEFVVLAEVESDDEAFEIADRIAQVWEHPFAVASGEVFCSASVGIAVGREAQSPAKMLREADAAMYRAKERGRGRAEIFDEEMRRDAFERLRTESDLRRALERDEFHVLYQPIFDTVTLRPMGVEALVRWQHPTRGIVGPVEFIPLAEETGLIAPLGKWVLEHAVGEVADWRQRFPEVPLRVAVNVSGQQLARPEFLHEVRAALAASGLPPESLGLEITESILIKESGSPRTTLEALRAMGVKVLIDDFGTGYSSLARLKRFPLDVIKVDRSFVDGVGAEDEDTAIVAAIVDIARSLGLQVIAEGVEGEVQLQRLRELGCHGAQGYLFSGPLPGDAFAAFLADEEATPAAVGF